MIAPMCNGLPMTDEAPTIIGATEACRVLDVDKSTLTRWVHAGVIKTLGRLNGTKGALLFDRADVEAFRSQREAEVSA